MYRKKPKKKGDHRLKSDSIFNKKVDSVDLTENDLSPHIIEEARVIDFHPDPNTRYGQDGQVQIHTRELREFVLSYIQRLGWMGLIMFEEGVVEKRIAHRKRPERVHFNQGIVGLLLASGGKFTPPELFVEYCEYFSDSLENKFAMLTPHTAHLILPEHFPAPPTDEDVFDGHYDHPLHKSTNFEDVAFEKIGEKQIVSALESLKEMRRQPGDAFTSEELLEFEFAYMVVERYLYIIFEEPHRFEVSSPEAVLPLMTYARPYLK